MTAVLTVILAAALVTAPAANAATAAACPPSLVGKATCFTGQDTNGAYYTMAVPKRWNGSLVVHAHGGPYDGVLLANGLLGGGSRGYDHRVVYQYYRCNLPRPTEPQYPLWQGLGGRNPFSNQGVRYEGSHDDRALNAGVARFSADPTARRDFSYDSDLTGRVSLPVRQLDLRA